MHSDNDNQPSPRVGAEIAPADLMHPTLQRVPFTRAGWIFEHKLDGFRALARTGASPALLSRNGRSLAEAFPEVLQALATLRVSATVDCELVLTDGDGKPAWERLRRRAMVRRVAWARDAAAIEPAALCAFDLLQVDGQDLRERPLLERKARLAVLLQDTSVVHYVEHIEAHGEALFAKACELDLEGVVAKRADSPYRAGRRPEWLKIKNQQYSRQEALRFHG